MEKKRGFTLVELLAVIAILAILVIMALPAVLRMYRQSRINNFQNEVRSVYRTAQNQFLSDSILLGSGDHIVYTNGGDKSGNTTCASFGGNTVTKKKLDMTGNSKFYYLIEMTVSGQVVKVRATNETYSYKHDVTLTATETQTVDQVDGIKVEDIVIEDVSTGSGTHVNDLSAYDQTIDVCVAASSY